ncbi:PREDICTED: tektin-3-like, partial [Acanthisitta chloris]|uniref:tektin-3-like n=1 Tax=Acanthisitta chloris TaxID=57068 RepID=UPI0004F0C6E9
EVQVIRFCQESMQQCLHRVTSQLRYNQEAWQELMKDLTDKQMDIDNKCYQQEDTSTDTSFSPGVEKVDAKVSVPETQATFTDSKILIAQSTRATSARLRGNQDSLLTGTADDMWRQFHRVNSAIASRITEMLNTKSKIQTHLAKTQNEIFRMEANIRIIERTIKDKEVELKVAQTHLDEHTKRPSVVLCWDNAQHCLVNEVKEITETLRNLQHGLKASEDMLQMLFYAKAVLEYDLAVKNNSLFIDKKCMAMHKSFFQHRPQPETCLNSLS